MCPCSSRSALDCTLTPRAPPRSQLSKSTYHPGFDRLCKEVAAARVEANDNVKYLATLQKYFDKLNMADDFPVRCPLQILYLFTAASAGLHVCPPA